MRKKSSTKAEELEKRVEELKKKLRKRLGNRPPMTDEEFYSPRNQKIKERLIKGLH